VDQAHQVHGVRRLQSIEHPASDQILQGLAVDEARDPDHQLDPMTGLAADPAHSKHFDMPRTRHYDPPAHAVTENKAHHAGRGLSEIP
jgi:hypothetical protein